MKEQKQVALLWIAAFLPLVMVAAAWAWLPEAVPIRWGMNGEVDAYGGRWTLCLLALVSPLVLLMMRFTPQIDPKKENYQKFAGSYQAFQLGFCLFLDVVIGAMLAETLQPGTVSVAMVVQLMVAALLLFIGNMMPKFRQNYFCGIKTPWTLSSERVWTKTHRLGGRLHCAAGLAALAGAFLPPVGGFAVLMTAVLAASLVPLVMSYLWFRQEQAG